MYVLYMYNLIDINNCNCNLKLLIIGKLYIYDLYLNYAYLLLDGMCLFLKIFNVYFWERKSMSGEGAEREGDTEWEAGSRLRAVSTEPDAGLEPMDREIMTWAKSDR